MIANINEKIGSEEQSHKILIDILKNSRNYTKNLIKECLKVYARMLFKKGYFVEAEDYLNQSKQIEVVEP